MSYQIAFDLYESATQQFLGRVLEALRATAPLPHLLEDKVKPKVTVDTTAATEQPEVTEAKVEIKDERTFDSLVNLFDYKIYVLLKINL